MNTVPLIGDRILVAKSEDNLQFSIYSSNNTASEYLMNTNTFKNRKYMNVTRRCGKNLTMFTFLYGGTSKR
jgi:hypothetical protein